MERDGDILLTRAGKFSRGSDGALRNSDGMALQLAGGGNAVVGSERVEVLADGTILDRGAPVGVIGVYAAPAGATGTGGRLRGGTEPVEVDEGRFEIRQGMLESSNVVLSDEMVAMMANVRQAEGAAQIVRLYDQLIGQAVTTFSRAGR